MEAPISNPLLCDHENGTCTLPGLEHNKGEETILFQNKAEQKPIRITYFTDPICSACWGMEPQLRKLKLDYGDFIHIACSASLG